MELDWLLCLEYSVGVQCACGRVCGAEDVAVTHVLHCTLFH